MQSTNPSPVSAPDPIVSAAPPKSQTVASPRRPRRRGRSRPPHDGRERIRSTVVVVAALLVLAGFIIYVAGVPLPGLSAAEGPQTVQKAAPLKIEVLSHKGEPLTVLVPEDVRQSLGIRTKSGAERLATAQQPAEAWPLVLSGSTALDPAQPDAHPGTLRPGRGRRDRQGGRPQRRAPPRTGSCARATASVRATCSAIFYSVDRRQQEERPGRRPRATETRPGNPRGLPAGLRQGRHSHARPPRRQEGCRERLQRHRPRRETLRAWTVPEEDIEAVRKEAEEINSHGGQARPRPRNLKEQLRRWARWSCAPADDGTIVERNVNEHEMVVDPTINLFQVAQVDRLLVVANAPEDKVAGTARRCPPISGAGSSAPPAPRPRESSGPSTTSATSSTSTSTTPWSRATSPTRRACCAAGST